MNEFPLREIIDGLGFPIIIIILLILSPAILGGLLGELGKLIRKAFGKDDND